MHRHSRFCALLAVILAGFSTMPLLQPRFFASSDGLFHLYRLMEYDIAIRDGVWYPRWAPDFFFGMGMPNFNYYAPLTYYVAEVFRLLGAGYIDSFRLFAIVVMSFSGLGAYLYGRTLLSPVASLLVAVVYMYVPYQLVNLYYRGDMAEFAAYVWFPLILWALARLLEQRRSVYIALGGAFYAALILTHNLSAFIFSGFLLIYAVALLIRYHGLRPKQWKGVAVDTFRMATVAALGAGLSSFFWAPAMIEKPLVNIDHLLKFDFRAHFPTLEQLFSTSLVHEYSLVSSFSETYSYKLGMLQIAFLVLGSAAIARQFRIKKQRGVRVEGTTSLLVAALSLFLISAASAWVWDNIPLLNLTQFPWRFLAFIALPTALLAGIFVDSLSERVRLAAVPASVALVIFSSTAGILPPMSDVSEADLTPRGSIEFELASQRLGTTSQAEFIPKWVKEIPATSSIALATILNEETSPVLTPGSSGMEVSQVEKHSDRLTFKVRAQKTGPMVVKTAFFPGWEAFVDGKPTNIEVGDPDGLIKIQVPAGEHMVNLRFVETPLRQISDAISIVAILVMLVLLALEIKNRRRHLLRLPPISLDRATAAKVGIVFALLPVWLVGKAAYDTAYAPFTPHQFPLLIDLEKGVRIEGFDLREASGENATATRLIPGSSVPVAVYWRMLEVGTTEPLIPFLRLTNHFDQTWAYAEPETAYVNTDMKIGALITTTLTLSIPSGTPPGVYRFEVGFRTTNGEPLEPRRVWMVPLFPDENGLHAWNLIVGRESAQEPATNLGPTPWLPSPVSFDNDVRLLDFRVTDGEALRSGKPGTVMAVSPEGKSWEAYAGDVVHLDLLWLAARAIDDNYRVTLRLVDAAHNLWAVRDSQPADGLYPTSFWSKGEVVRDQLNLRIPPETPPGQYELQVEVISVKGPLSLLDQNGAGIGPTMQVGRLVVLPPEKAPDPWNVTTQNRADVSIGGGLSIMGYSLGRTEIKPGEPLAVELLWKATKPIARDLLARLQLVDKSGNVWGSDSTRPVGDTYPTSAWRTGDVLRGKYSLKVRPGAPEGEAELKLELVDAQSGETMGRLSLPTVRLLPRTRQFSATPTNPTQYLFDDKIRLLGYDVGTANAKFLEKTPEIAPAGILEVSLYWQAVSAMKTSYTIFVQVLDSNGRLVAQSDSLPENGQTPTTAMMQGEVVADKHQVSIPAGIPTGSYTIITGVYDAATGERLSIAHGSDYAVLSPLNVLAPQ